MNWIDWLMVLWLVLVVPSAIIILLDKMNKKKPKNSEDEIKDVHTGLTHFEIWQMKYPEFVIRLRQQTAEEIFNHKSKFLVFDTDEKGTIYIWNKNKDPLGTIYYYSKWRKYVLQIGDLIYDFDCLLGILSKIFEIDEEIKQKYLGDEK